MDAPRLREAPPDDDAFAPCSHVSGDSHARVRAACGAAARGMYFYGPAAAGADGDNGDVLGNVRRIVGPNADWWLQELACCLCGCLSTGPMFIVVGMLFMARPRAFSRSARS